MQKLTLEQTADRLAGLERVLMLLDSEGIELPKPNQYEIFITYMGANRGAAFRTVQALRAEGIRADMDHCGRSLKAQFKYANKTGAPLTGTIGDDEAAQHTLKIKNMATGEDFTVPAEEAAEKIRELIK